MISCCLLLVCNIPVVFSSAIPADACPDLECALASAGARALRVQHECAQRLGKVLALALDFIKFPLTIMRVHVDARIP
eukprot:6201902-Pleurochrysis_carterae.AAC.1